MSEILFLGVPSFGHINPTIGLIAELVKRGERVTYFASAKFREPIEAAGAELKCYGEDLDMFAVPRDGRAPAEPSPRMRVLAAGPAIVSDILAQTRGRRFDCLIHSAAFPFADVVAQILGVPSVSSLGIFLGLDMFLSPARGPSHFIGTPLEPIYRGTAQALVDAYGIDMPEDPIDLMLSKGDLNLVYTSRYFAGGLPYFDDSFLFIGPPVYDRKETTEFPLEALDGKSVLYISLGTVFSGFDQRLYGIFFDAFRDWDGIVVLSAYKIDYTVFDIPSNFIISDYVPQNAVLKRATAAITHCGMNSLNDILAHQVPFVALPLGADQPLLAARAESLDATITLDATTLTPGQLSEAVAKVTSEPRYRAGMQRIVDSFAEAGGFPKAADAILDLVRTKSRGRHFRARPPAH